ncbi:MAG: ABC transporter ATP-binding protein [Phycisphaerae bacterium]|nr:ABC transporter ATP-binding protein [Phycisphaerae bacterium]
MTTRSFSQFAIETVGLTKRFGDALAVDDLTLRIPVGSTFGFIGPNGAGKTTTIKMLMGMLRKTAGQARVLGLDVSARCEAMKQRIGYVPELHFIYPWMRVGDVIGFCRSFYGTWNDRLCAELLDSFDLDVNRKVKHLSKGMAAKLALLVAIAHEPELLILDEPTSGLDPIIREEFLDGILRAICERRRTVLFSSHTLSDVQRLADTVGIIYEGHLLVHCPTDDLLTGTKRIRAVLRDGCQPGKPPDGTIWQRLQRREWLLTVRGFTPATLDYLRNRCPVENVEVIDLGLEDVFKDYVKGRRALT